MVLLELIFVLLVVLTVGIGLLAYRGHWGARIGPSAVAHRTAERLGSTPAAALFLVVGAAVTFVVSLGLGFIAKALEASVDHPVYNWVTPRIHKAAPFTKANLKLTNIGLNSNVQLVVLFAVIGLAFAYKRRWWISPVLVIGMFYLERYWQRWLAKIVDRGHPPTTLGTFPSGGVGRILSVYGIIIVLVICLFPSMSRAWRAGFWTVLATAAVVEAFTRVYLSLHWFTDALFALPFGALLCVTGILTVTALTHSSAARPAGRHNSSAVTSASPV